MRARTEAHRIYVISDLHLGGSYPTDGDPASRGFRICTRVSVLAEFIRSLAASAAHVDARTELVINGDFLDFLAERWDEEAPWLPFLVDQEKARQRFLAMAQRDAVVFSALGAFLGHGHLLTVLIGNHDLEMSLPAVRAEFERLVGGGGTGRLRYIFDGEAYAVGPVLIEHGNRYDRWNVVDHDGLRRFRSMLSRRESVRLGEEQFSPPAGSYLVAAVMNQIKDQYRFIDLLKPETEAALPILLALAPEYRQRILAVGCIAARTAGHGIAEDGLPEFSGDIAATPSAAETSISRMIEAAAGSSQTEQFMAAIREAVDTAPEIRLHLTDDIASVTPDTAWQWLKAMVSGRSKPLHTRLPALLSALRVLRNEKSMQPDSEAPTYLEAAKRHFRRGFDVVVFGHTHLAKEISSDDPRGVYLNTGTWADLVHFPYEVLDMEPSRALGALKQFVADLESNQLADYIRFIPTYARIELKRDKVVDASLHVYQEGGRVH